MDDPHSAGDAAKTPRRATGHRRRTPATTSHCLDRCAATPEPLRRAFAGIRAAFPDLDGTRAEVAWSALHGLATLQAAGRLATGQAQARLDLLHRLLTQQENPS